MCYGNNIFVWHRQFNDQITIHKVIYLEKIEKSVH